MILINKLEKEAISERFPDVHIVRTMKQKSKRHRYYCEETKQVMRFLRKQRQLDRGSTPQRREARYADRTNGKRITT